MARFVSGEVVVVPTPFTPPSALSPQLVTCKGQRFWYGNTVSDAKTQ
jgi:hypothetical protein